MQTAFPNRKIDYPTPFNPWTCKDKPIMVPLCPWPLKMGRPTTSLIRLHKKGCRLGPRPNSFDKAEDIFICCKCPSWRKYLRMALKGQSVDMILDEAA